MRIFHGSRSATRSHQPVAPVTPTATPNAGRFPARPQPSDDILILDTTPRGLFDLFNWQQRARHTAHRPAQGMPACGASGQDWHRIGAYRIEQLNAYLCPSDRCFGGPIGGVR